MPYFQLEPVTNYRLYFINVIMDALFINCVPVCKSRQSFIDIQYVLCCRNPYISTSCLIMKCHLCHPNGCKLLQNNLKVLHQSQHVKLYGAYCIFLLIFF